MQTKSSTFRFVCTGVQTAHEGGKICSSPNLQTCRMKTWLLAIFAILTKKKFTWHFLQCNFETFHHHEVHPDQDIRADNRVPAVKMLDKCVQ
jgi:hypothetical protein